MTFLIASDFRFASSAVILICSATVGSLLAMRCAFLKRLNRRLHFLSMMDWVVGRKSPLIPLCQRGILPNEKNFPSLKKHALSVVEGSGQGRFWTGVDTDYVCSRN